jgi:thiol-disulfide isomerase/thioredoxin
MSRSRGRLMALGLALLMLAGCGGQPARQGGGTPKPSGPPCVTPAASSSPAPASSPAPVSSAAPASTAGPTGPATGEPLADITLPCFAGGQPVRLAHLGEPTVINLWASWCAPCRTELPQIQRYAERAAGRVQVIGVITSDPNRGGAQSLIDDLGLRFPMLYDEPATLRAQVGVQALPLTLLVDAGGRVAYRYNARPLDEAALADLVDRYLGVRA